ncbi:MAG TPA: DUF2336 domain-containing protein, partial [Alphaproteobacteria bacterium]|nr:DUF2336 domain-containing protein [Alphaproteobacteria bacterium]
KDVEIVVRRAVSQNLRRSKHLPRDVAMKLAEDVEAVALPIITDSIALTDDDLISLLDHSSMIKQKAIASRPDVSEKVSEAVIATTNEVIVSTLMKNKSAHISDKGFDRAIERFPKSEMVKESMVMREQLPPVIAERLVTIVSERLQDHLASHHKLPETLASEILTHSRERAVIQINMSVSDMDIESTVAQMHANKRLTPTLILRALCVGNMSFFEHALAAMAGIPVDNARRLIHDPGTEPLERLAEKAGVPPHFARVMRIALDVMYQLKQDGLDNDIDRFRARLIERVLTQTTDLDPKDQEYLLDLIK